MLVNRPTNLTDGADEETHIHHNVEFSEPEFLWTWNMRYPSEPQASFSVAVWGPTPSFPGFETYPSQHPLTVNPWSWNSFTTIAEGPHHADLQGLSWASDTPFAPASYANFNSFAWGQTPHPHEPANSPDHYTQFGNRSSSPMPHETGNRRHFTEFFPSPADFNNEAGAPVHGFPGFVTGPHNYTYYLAPSSSPAPGSALDPIRTAGPGPTMHF
jgi:hypothetical protein